MSKTREKTQRRRAPEGTVCDEMPVIEPKQRFLYGDAVRVGRRTGTVCEIVAPQGRPTTPGLSVSSIRMSESYVVAFDEGGERRRHAWPQNHEIEAARVG